MSPTSARCTRRPFCLQHFQKHHDLDGQHAGERANFVVGQIEKCIVIHARDVDRRRRRRTRRSGQRERRPAGARQLVSQQRGVAGAAEAYSGLARANPRLRGSVITAILISFVGMSQLSGKRRSWADRRGPKSRVAPAAPAWAWRFTVSLRGERHIVGSPRRRWTILRCS